MASDFDNVGQFHEKFGLPIAGGSPTTISDDAALFRLKFMLEELIEIADGYGYHLTGDFVKVDEQQDLPKIADGLVDLVYVALGTAHLHSFPWSALFKEVQRANLSKERATHDGDKRSTRAHQLDVVKTKDFQPPNIVEVLMRAGWPGPALPGIK